MKKRGAILALLLAGVMSMGVIATAGCKDRDEGHVHTWTAYKSNGASGHYRQSTCWYHATVEEEEEHEYDGNVCIKCNYVNSSGDIGGGEEDPDPEKPVVLSEDTAISLTVGETQTISAAEGAEFNSQHPTVATVDSNGKISAKTAGVAKVTATAGNSVITCTVIVLAKPAGAESEAPRDPFSFNKTINIGNVETTTTPPVSDANADEYKVSFSNGIDAQYVAKGGLAVEPVGVENDGHYLQGWYTEAGYSNMYNFATPVTSTLNLYAKWGELPGGVTLAEGNFESIALEWSGSVTGASVSYKLAGTNSWTQIDEELIRADGSGVRADIVGIKAGTYDVKINTGSGEKTLSEIQVKKYDRAGYAHFNYTEGVGAYKDDGTLKENALVIYVTDENKDTVMRDLDDATVKAQMFDIPYYAGVSGADKNWNKKAEGIGWWLNNVQYTKKDKNGKVNSNTYSEKGSTLGFGNSAFDDIPVVIRFIGTVTTPEGCTAYNSLGEGGSVGDNGHMARMKNLKNITIEGIGDDAQIKGWGFHFMAGSDAKNGRGKGFEVRNLTFNEYPEDAVGMEGVQSGGKITGSVERCWIHNNTFLPGRCDNPAESDKKEGDGSCDFKRGMYFTCSYNYFEFCHKTNLVGSADDSLQYNMTYHHNFWYQCGSRIPLTRQANVHFYNNYVFGDQLDTSTPYSHIAKASLSYVHSLRANCYIYTEHNYYEGCKNVTDGKSGGTAKGWQNSIVSCAGTNTITTAASRTTAVSGGCAYDGTTYQNFDTNDKLFYYDSASQKTDVELLDDSISARTRAVMYSGASGHGKESLTKLNFNRVTPINAVEVSSEGATEINVSTPKAGTVINGVRFLGTYSAGKGKGQLAVFTLAAPAELTIAGSGKDVESNPQVIRSDGKIMVSKFSGTVNVLLGEGTYVIAAGQKDKEATLTQMSFADTGASGEVRINAAKAAIGAIPDTVSRSSNSVVEAAERAYSALRADEKADFPAELYDRLLKAKQAISDVNIQYVIARIDYIGTVTANSGDVIAAANNAYTSLIAAEQAKVTNYGVLAAAQAKFAGFATDAVKNKIGILPAAGDFDKIIDSKPAIELVLEMYNGALSDYYDLDEDVRGDISIAGINGGIETLTKALRPFEVKELLTDLPDKNASGYYSHVGDLKKAYDALDEAQKSVFTADEKAKLEEAFADYAEYVNQAKVAIFTKGNPALATNEGFTVTSGNYKTTSEKFTYNGTEYDSPLKMQSSTKVTFTTATEMTVRLVIHNGGSSQIKVDDVTYNATNGTIVIEKLAAGNHTIAKASGEAWLCYVVLSPAN